jgi:hypothetical protein
MAMKRRVVRSGSGSIAVWSCSECAWREVGLIDKAGEITDPEARKLFGAHNCLDYPEKQSLRAGTLD